MKKLVIGFMSLAATFAAAAPASAADFTIRSAFTGLCLEASSSSAGASVTLQACDSPPSAEQTWAAGAWWPSPNNMFTHILNRVNGPTSTDRCLGLSSNLAIDASCNNNSTDTDDKGWWVDYAGDYEIPGLPGELQHCYSFKSKIDTSTVLTTATGWFNDQPTRSAKISPTTLRQIWCVVEI